MAQKRWRHVHICTHKNISVSRICQALDFWDKDWLLKNNLDSPVPPVLRSRSIQEDAQADVVNELFSRLFDVVAKMDKHRARLMIELYVAAQLDALRKEEHVPRPDGQPKFIAVPAAIQYFIKDPELFDPDLREWVNLKGLLKLSDRFAPQAEKASPKRPKPPSRTPASPSLDGQRKKLRSS